MSKLKSIIIWCFLTNILISVNAKEFNKCSKKYLNDHTTFAKDCYLKIILNETICSDGYYKDVDNKCIPKCDENCENGKCIAPNNCACLLGYKPFTTFKCIPDCNNCTNGRCTAPNMCECNEGYSNNMFGSCFPKCNETCENGDCIKSNECKCLPGYFTSSYNLFKCIPKCTDACIFGECIAPDVCKCLQGYKYNNESSNECVPACEKSCINGICVGVNNCNCDIGFELTENDKFNCQPICSPKCINGECISPNKCECHTGFKLANGSTYNCISLQCKIPCKNGICLDDSTNVCKCNDGFKLNILNKYECLPIHYDSYDSDDGKKINNNTASSLDSSSPCTNEYCIKTNCGRHFYMCHCLEGYTSIYINDTLYCKPNCIDNCRNGTCIAPNKCECFDGFTLNNFICEPIENTIIQIPPSLLIIRYMYVLIIILVVAMITIFIYFIQEYCKVDGERQQFNISPAREISV